MSDSRPAQGSIRVAIAQGNIDQSVKWNPAYQEKTLQIYKTLTLQSQPFARTWWCGLRRRCLFSFRMESL